MSPPLRRILESVLPSNAYIRIRTLWRHVLRVSAEGFFTAYQRRRLWPKILETAPVYTDPLTQGCELSVHLMCYQVDYLCAIWALKSFYHQAKTPLPLIIHVQGKSTPLLESRLRGHFPNARLILQAEADRAVESYLRNQGCFKLLEYRKALPTVQKLTDFLILANSRRVVIFDADVLFFDCPKELVNPDPEPDESILFQRDFIDAYTIPPSRARSDLGIDMQSKINVGIVRVAPDKIDLRKCEEYLAHPEFANFEGHTEQTLWALEASRNDAVSYLPLTYLVSLEKRVDYGILIARHYAGPSRGLLTRQGIPHLVRSGFLQALEKDPSQPTRETVRTGF